MLALKRYDVNNYIAFIIMIYIANEAAGANERVCGECPTRMLIYYADHPSPLYVPPSYVVVTFYAKGNLGTPSL